MTVRLLFKKVIFCLSVMPLFLFSNPTGEQVTSGSATFDRTDADTLSVMQMTNKAIIDWQDFSIAAGECTQFIQPNARAAVLNRVVGENLSEIHGSLQANGHVFLINQNGIVIGPNGSIKTNGFFASTHDLTNDSFLKSGPKKRMCFSGDSVEKVCNEGRIEALQGDIFLIAREVENKGDLLAPKGTVGLEAGMEILIVNPKDHHHIALKVKGDGQISQTGNIQALNANLQAVGGNIYSLAINLDGTVEAIGAEEVGGEIILSCKEGVVFVGGNLTACKNDKGGKIHILADDITIEDSAVVNASGATGGGTILIGGDYRGRSSDRSVFNASRNIISRNAVIKADAFTDGNGGKAICWANYMLDFCGTVTAEGGKEAGNGGFIEISGKRGYFYRPTHVSTFAYNGENGQLLLDPSDVNIVASGTNFPASPNLAITYPPTSFATDTATLVVTDLQTALNLNNVTIDTNNGGGGVNGVITINTNITWSAATTLTLNANNRVNFDGSGGAITISNTNNAGTNFNALAVTTLSSSSSLKPIVLNYTTITTLFGNVSLAAPGTSSTGQPLPFPKLVAITIDNTSQINSTGLGANAANIQLTGTVTTGGGDGSSNGIFIGAGSSILTIDGSISLTGTSDGRWANNIGILLQGAHITSSGTGGTGTITLIGKGSDPGTGNNNHGISLDTTASTITSATGAIQLTGTGGGTGASADNEGIHNSFATISSTGTGGTAATITLSGRGGDVGSNCYGVQLTSTNAVVSSVDGAIIIEGRTDSTASGQTGVYIDAGAKVNSTGTATGTKLTIRSSANIVGINDTEAIFINGSGTQVNTNKGDISITGTVAATGANASGIVIKNGAVIQSTGTGGAVGNITLNGTLTGGASTATSNGIFLEGTSPAVQITTVDGAISLTGTSDGTGATNIGILAQGAQITSSGTGGTGTITLIGQGSDPGTGNNNHGISLDTTASTITSATGAIQLTGTGGGTGGSSADNEGIEISSATISSTGMGASAATITLSGTGGNVGNNCFGTRLINTSAVVTSVDGAIVIEGQTFSTSPGQSGVDIGSGAKVNSTGTATGTKLTIRSSGTITGGIDTEAILISTSGTEITTNNGDISIIGTSAGVGVNAKGILIENGALIQSITGSGAININGTGSAAGTNTSAGVYIGGTVESTLGNIVVTGNAGGSSTGTTNHGVQIEAATGILRSTGTTAATAATIQVTANGSVATGTSNRAFSMNTAGTLTTIAGDVTITAIAAAGHPEVQGIYMDGGSSITTTGAGSLTLDGTGGTGGSGAGGIKMIDADVRSTSTASDAGAISMTGTVVTTVDDSPGIDLRSTDGMTHQISSKVGNITLIGTGKGTTSTAHGIAVVTVNASSIAEISMTTPGTGNISLFGTAATTNGDGISLFNTVASASARIYTQGAGTVTLRGLAQTGHYGMSFSNTGTETVGDAAQTGEIAFQINTFATGGSAGLPGNFTSTSGDVSLRGEAINDNVIAGFNPLGTGLLLSDTDLVFFEGGTPSPARILLGSENSTGSATTLSRFILGKEYLIRGFTVNTSDSDSGNIAAGTNALTITATSSLTMGTMTGFTGAGGAIVMQVTNGSLILPTGAAAIAAGTGNLTLQANIMDWTAGTISGTGTLAILPMTPTLSIGLGTDSSGTMNLNNTELGLITAGFTSITFGDSAGMHIVTIGDGITGVQAFDDPIVIQGASRVEINSLSALTAGTNNDITINGNIINLLANSNLNAAGTGNATFNITGSTGGTVSLNDTVTATTFAINGSSLNDTFNVNVNGITATLNGTGGTNTLLGPSITDNTWNMTALNTGTLANISFSNIQNLTGSSTKDDTFVLNGNTSGISGALNGGAAPSSNTLSYQGWNPSALVNIGAGTGSGISGGFINIEEVIGTTLDHITRVSESTAYFADVVTANQSTNNPNQLGTFEAVISKDSGAQALVESFSVLMNAASITPLTMDDIGTISGGQSLREVDDATLPEA